MDVDRLCYLGHLVTITSAPRKFIQGAGWECCGTVAARALSSQPIFTVFRPSATLLRDLAIPMSRLEGRLLVEVDHDGRRGLSWQRGRPWP